MDLITLSKENMKLEKEKEKLAFFLFQRMKLHWRQNELVKIYWKLKFCQRYM